MRRINRCLNTRLIDICKRTVQLENLSSKLLSFLPVNLQTHCQVGSFSGGCLVIVADDPVWALELRYMLPDLRDKLRIDAGIYQLTSIKLTLAVETKTSSTKKIARQPSLLSANARQAIIAGGDQCSYQPLKNALLELARTKKQDA